MTQGITTGSRLGPYEIAGWIGSGGMGEVYRALDTRLGREVALKLISGAASAEPSRLRRFEHEARAAAAIAHPNILAVHDVGVEAGVPFLVSELLEGESLRSRLRGGALPIRKAIEIARQTAEGLAAAHDKGIVHRDVKPDNIFLTADGRVKILDFGIAKLNAPAEEKGRIGAPTETGAGVIVGTTGYMSPEQVRGETVDGRSDIFSLGTVLYEMAAGRAAFARETSADTMAAILNAEPPELEEGAVPTAIARVIARCLEKGREARYQSARDLAFGLEVLTGSSVTARGTRRRVNWRALLLPALTVASLAAAAAGWLRQPPPPPPENPLALAKFSVLTDFEGTETDAAISVDGRFVAFLSDRDGPFHVWLKQVGTGPFRNLTPGQPDLRNIGPNRSVGFSGDGGDIWINGTRERRMARMPLMGGTPRPFLAAHAVNVVWSPDGASLLYFTWDGDPLIVEDNTGARSREILPPRAGDHNHFPAWSFDGRWIYYAHASQSVWDYDIWRIPSAGGTPERLTRQNTDIRYLTMIDAGTLLYVAPDANGSGPWLWALDVDRKITRRISGGLERYLTVAASGDGRRIVATVAGSTGGLWTVPIVADGIAGTDDVKPYAGPTARAQAPRFGGDSLFYLSSSGAGAGLWRMVAGDPVEVWRGSDEPLIEVPAVSKNGDRVAVVIRRGNPRLTLMSADGTDRVPLAESIAVRGTPAWSPDGQWIVTGGSDRSGPGLFKIPIDGGSPVPLMRGPAADPVWSPDGRVIIYLGQQDANAPLLAVSDDGTPIKLPPLRVPTSGRGLARFLPDGKGLVYVQGQSGEQNFWMLDMSTLRSRQLTRLAGGASTSAFDVTPDGRQIVFDRLRERSDIVLIELPKPGAGAPGPASR